MEPQVRAHGEADRGSGRAGHEVPGQVEERADVELETVAFDRPRRWTMHNGGPIEVTFTCRLEPVPRAPDWTPPSSRRRTGGSG